MSVDDVRSSISSPSIPSPRTTGSPPAVESAPSTARDVELQQETAPEPARYPWPEPWRSVVGARPRTEYWDVTTASWHSRGPRRG